MQVFIRVGKGLLNYAPEEVDCIHPEVSLGKVPITSPTKGSGAVSGLAGWHLPWGTHVVEYAQQEEIQSLFWKSASENKIQSSNLYLFLI